MSLLAQTRRKQIISVNPQGKNEASEWQQFGKRLMQKSGWQDGDGLGSERQGSKDFIQMSFKDDNRGLGCSIQYERNWLAHNEDFNSLLSSLNHNYGEAPGGNKSKDSVEQETIAEERVSLEHKSKTSGKRIHYQKFARGKDLSSRSTDDISKIFGGKMPQKAVEEKVSIEATSEGDEPVHGITGLHTVKSKDSIHDYFARKMAAKKKPGKSVSIEEAEQQGNGGNEEHNTEPIFSVVRRERKKKREKPVVVRDQSPEEIDTTEKIMPVDTKESFPNSETNTIKKKRKRTAIFPLKTDDVSSHPVVTLPDAVQQSLEGNDDTSLADENSELVESLAFAPVGSMDAKRKKRRPKDSLELSVTAADPSNYAHSDHSVLHGSERNQTHTKKKAKLQTEENGKMEVYGKLIGKNRSNESLNSSQMKADLKTGTDAGGNETHLDDGVSNILVSDYVVKNKKKKRKVGKEPRTAAERVENDEHVDEALDPNDARPITTVTEKSSVVITSKNSDGFTEVISAVTLNSRVTYGPTMAGIRQYFRNLPPDVKDQIYVGSNIFDIAGYGDDLLF